MEYEIRKPDELYHYGVKGMKWNKRRSVKTLGDTAQFVSDKGFVESLKGEKLYKETNKKHARAMKMDTVDSIAKKSAKTTKIINKKKPQIKAASRLLVAETANAAATGINEAIRVNRRNKRW